MLVICICKHKVDDAGDVLVGLLGKADAIESQQPVVEWDSGSWGFYTPVEFENYCCRVLGSPKQEQALKHFDDLLRAAQEVVNDATPSSRYRNCVLVDSDLLDSLKAIVQKISDEAAEQAADSK